MNLLEKVLDAELPTPETLSPPEAFVAMIVLATVSDSYLTDEQESYLTCALSHSRPLKNYSQDAICKLLDRILDILWRDDFNTLFNLAKRSLPPELREPAFALAADLVLAEISVTDEEKNFLKDFYQALGIPYDIATQILQVMSIKHQLQLGTGDW